MVATVVVVALVHAAAWSFVCDDAFISFRYARNLADGRVEVLACGEDAAVNELVAWLWQGSPASKVTDVATEHADPGDAQRTMSFTSA